MCVTKTDVDAKGRESHSVVHFAAQKSVGHVIVLIPALRTMSKKYSQNCFPRENIKLPVLIPAIITNLSLSPSLTTSQQSQRLNAVN